MKFLATARDAGAARHIVEIVKAANRLDGVSARLYAADVAATALSQCGESFDPFPVSCPYDPVATCEAYEVVEKAVERLIDAEAPDAVLVGLANFRRGVDDATLTVAGRRGLPRILMLDDVGHVESDRKVRPDAVLAVNATVAAWSDAYLGVPCYTIGSPRLHAYAQLDSGSIRARLRAVKGVGLDETLIAFFAQTSTMPGHDENVKHLAQALQIIADTGRRFRLISRPHPGFPETGEQSYETLAAAGLDVMRDDGGDPSHLLAASDIVLSCVSSTISDYQWVARSSSAMNALTAYLLIGETIQSYISNYTGGYPLPLVDRGMSRALRTPQELSDFLVKAVDGELLPPAYARGISAEDASLRAIDVIRELCGVLTA